MQKEYDSVILSEKDRQSIDAAKLYYQSHYSQQQVADTLGISRPTVSKLLQYASEKGFVVITIKDPQDSFLKLAETLKYHYQLDSVSICPTPINNNREELQKAIGVLGARVLESLVCDNDIISVEWSNTIHAMAQQLEPQLHQGIQVVQLRGCDTKVSQGLNESKTISLISKAFNAQGQLLPLPIVFEQVQTKNLIQRESSIWRILENAKESRIAVFTAGTVSNNSVLFNSGFYTQDEMRLLQKRSIGSICAHFVDRNGRVCLPDLNNRTVGIGLPDLRTKKEKVLISGGQKKAVITHVILKYGYANHLVTDKLTADLLLELINEEQDSKN